MIGIRVCVVWVQRGQVRAPDVWLSNCALSPHTENKSLTEPGARMVAGKPRGASGSLCPLRAEVTSAHTIPSFLHR